ncbi:hypothetical protein BOTBODRAFT_43101 [Botryobasidium botryosum FD-172 SS1]|uniref:Uncharacterized protein n=1 Tax=Botryobasidium botryosum (strain FD-172 SS1) TaxID=930990 RepID=A0A067MYH9_BOTB1|nr:hypothetical protein BOTBODRAFT_43101 [Botryobasidium botryosum FD-172 SS1]
MFSFLLPNAGAPPLGMPQFSPEQLQIWEQGLSRISRLSCVASDNQINICNWFCVGRTGQSGASGSGQPVPSRRVLPSTRNVWAEAVNHAAWLKNRMSTRASPTNTTLYMVATGLKPNLAQLPEFERPWQSCDIRACCEVGLRGVQGPSTMDDIVVLEGRMEGDGLVERGYEVCSCRSGRRVRDSGGWLRITAFREFFTISDVMKFLSEKRVCEA